MSGIVQTFSHQTESKKNQIKRARHTGYEQINITNNCHSLVNWRNIYLVLVLYTFKSSKGIQ